MPTNIALYDGSTDPADHLNRFVGAANTGMAHCRYACPNDSANTGTISQERSLELRKGRYGCSLYRPERNSTAGRTLSDLSFFDLSFRSVSHRRRSLHTTDFSMLPSQ
ncbi:hypothetical protein Tco_0722315 [Tanacetum coccineum]